MLHLQDYINESFDTEYLKLSSKDKQKLLDLDLEYGKLALIARYETVVREVSNKDEEYNKFVDLYIKKGIKYFPILKYKKLKYKKYNLKERVIILKSEFQKLNCYLSKFYIKNLESILKKIDYLENLESNNYELDNRINMFDDKLIDKAYDIIKKYPFKIPTDKKFEKNINADEASKIIKDELDKLGYDWEIIMKPNMLPRMGVNPEKTFRIKTSAKFSEIDIKSLIAHEIKAHVAKRFYGYKAGLFLFVFGLDGKNMFDEGLAIWNTLNIIDEPKPNALFKIAISYIICYYCAKYDFCEAFDKIKELVKNTDYSDKTIFSQLIRCKRSVIKTDRLGFWSGDIDYFRGYSFVDTMTASERDKILKYNVGIESYYEIDTIEKFLKTNKIKELSNNKLNEIKKEYLFDENDLT